MEKPDDFRINLCVKHPSLDPSTVSESLNIQPQFAWGVGDPVGSRARRSTLWHGILFEGSGAIEFERALTGVLSLLSDRQDFLSEITTSGGELSLMVRTVAELQDGKVAEVRFNASFLEALARRSVDLVFEVWMNSTEVETSIRRDDL
jgi:hypothetical protein